MCEDTAKGMVAYAAMGTFYRAVRCRQVWFVVVVAVLAASAAQLGLVSDVWAPSKDPPSGKLKIAIYFAQVSPHA